MGRDDQIPLNKLRELHFTEIPGLYNRKGTSVYHKTITEEHCKRIVKKYSTIYEPYCIHSLITVTASHIERFIKLSNK